jgi:D-alanyl-D-alanine-carboxypeptidase/D-alanyl-D-alanine-endopeptidase
LPEATSLLRLNSLSKLMAGEIAASLLEARRLRLDTPLQSFARQGWRVPVLAGARQITLRDLLTHVSGLPRDLPTSLEQVSQETRWRWLSRVRLLHQPGTIAQYSNAAYMFLGDAMARATGRSMAQLLSTRITAPLGMSDTGVAPDPGQCARLMSGGQPADRPCSPAPETAATAGIYSSPADMAIWMQAVMDARPGTFRYRARQPLVTRERLRRLIGMDMAGETRAIGFGWIHMTLAGEPVIQKTGGGGGFMNYMILSPHRRIGLFITVTRTDIEMLRAMSASANALLVRRFASVQPAVRSDGHAPQTSDRKL